MKIYDFCLFNNEFDVLDLRLNYMKSFVDKFFVCEINITHQSNPSEFYSKKFIENYTIAKELMDQDRLVFISIELEPDNRYFGVENRHRIELGNWVKKNINEEYIGILADCDEIISEDFKNHLNEIKDITRLDLKMFYFASDNYSHKHPWNYLVKSFHSSVLNHLNFQSIRDHFTNNIIYNIGWHFSCFGGVDRVLDKIKSFAHTEFNNDQHASIDILKKRLENREDYLGRPEFPCIEYSIEDYPERLKILLKERDSVLSISALHNKC
jgi:beta-1,4-mannosyl-glycoprotein beta-1,4-N-acetylglucosaminyltransferase